MQSFNFSSAWAMNYYNVSGADDLGKGMSNKAYHSGKGRSFTYGGKQNMQCVLAHGFLFISMVSRGVGRVVGMIMARFDALHTLDPSSSCRITSAFRDRGGLLGDLGYRGKGRGI